MTTYEINNYIVTLKLNTIIVNDKINKRIFQTELDYNNFILCENDDDLYDLLNEKLLEKSINFYLDNNRLIGTLRINITTTKFKEIKIEIPEVDYNFNHIQCTPLDTNNLSQTIELQKNQIELLIKKVTELEAKSNSILFFEEANQFIRSNCTHLCLNYGPNCNNIDFKNNYQSEHSIKATKSLHGSNYEIIVNRMTQIKMGDIPYKFIKIITIEDMYNFQYLINLVELHIQLQGYNKINMINLTAFNNLTNLEVLYISGSSELNDISTIRKFKKLKYLYLIDCINLEDISCLKDCPELIYLDISRSPNIKNLLMLTNPKLQIIK